MAMFKNRAIIVVLALFTACSGKESGQFAAPEFLRADVAVKGAEATFVCELSGNRVEQCGIVLEDRLIEGKMEGQAFTVTAGGLETGRTYTWSAFAKAGGSEITTPVQEFSAPDGNVPIPDPFFKQYLLEQFDLNKDGGISPKEALRITSIAVCTDRISSVQGIAFMPNLVALNVEGSAPGAGLLTELDVRGNPMLKHLSCINNRIATIDLSQNSLLERLLCWENILEGIDVSHNRDLQELACAQNLLTSIDVSENPNLRELHFNDTFVQDVDLSKNSSLERISCWNTLLSHLDLGHQAKLESLRCWGTELIYLDVSANPVLLELNCFSCEKLEVLYVEKGQQIPGVTVDRSEAFIPAYTQIVEKSVE